MANKPGTQARFVLFDVIYEDGSRRSNRKVPAELLGGLDGDAPARQAVEQGRLAYVWPTHDGDHGQCHGKSSRKLLVYSGFIRGDLLFYQISSSGLSDCPVPVCFEVPGHAARHSCSDPATCCCFVGIGLVFGGNG